MRTLILGLAIGAAVGYLLATEDKEELIEDAKKAAGKAKDLFNEGLRKGKKVMSDYMNTERDSEARGV